MSKAEKKAAAKPKGKAAPRKPARNTLMIIATLLAGSAAVRLAAGADTAFAKAADLTNAVSAPTCTTEEGVMALLSEVNARSDKLDERESLLANRATAISVAEDRLKQRIEEMKTAEAELAKTVQIADRGAEDDVTRLVTLYENMKPKQAVPLFETMAPEFAAGFLGRMQPAAAASIMAGLSPDTAYTISVLMAGRNANAPKR